MAKLDSPPAPDLVIRPAGVWDSRSPFYWFFLGNRNENEIYFALVLAIGRVSHDVDQAQDKRSLRKFLQAKTGSKTAGLAWTSYKRSIQSGRDELKAVSPVDFAKSLKRALPAVTEYALLSHCGLFETYCHCWALNMLLAVLEAGQGWEPRQRALARRFWPIGNHRDLPTLHAILRAFPILERELTSLPHIFIDPKTDCEVTTPISPTLNALEAVMFWREWRNLLVHSSGLVSGRFAAKTARFFHEAREGFPIADIVIGQPLTLRPTAFRAVATTHYRAAHRMREILVAASSERRGHQVAPSARKDELGPEEFAAPPERMLIPGDHEMSIRWTIDPGFRQTLHSYASRQVATFVGSQAG